MQAKTFRSNKWACGYLRNVLGETIKAMKNKAEAARSQVGIEFDRLGDNSSSG